MILQLAVSIQPVLPEKFHIAPVCMSIMHNLISAEHHQHAHDTYHELVHHLSDQTHHPDHNHHNHQCQYCTVHGEIVLPFSFAVTEVIDKIQIRLMFYKSAFQHVYFSLQRLYLLPQGRAPPDSFN